MLIRFSQIPAQEKAKAILARAVAGRKLAHAYLFRGPSGVGKEQAAHALAAAINCARQRRAGTSEQSTGRPDPEQGAAANLTADAGLAKFSNTAGQAETGRELEACGGCVSCRKFASGNHPDFMMVAPEGAAIKIQQVRAIRKALAFPPLEAEFRVVLLTEVQTMRREAANSLLKTLEEPPSATIFILTGDEAGAILPTILSRCQIVPFYPIAGEELTARLAVELQLEPATAATLAAVAEGSLGRARQLHEQELLPLRREIMQALVAHTPDQPEGVEAFLNLADRCAARKEDLGELLDLIRACFHDLAVLAGPATGQVTRPLLNPALAELFQQAAGRWNFTQLVERLKRLGLAQSQLKRNCNRGLVCEVLFFDLL